MANNKVNNQNLNITIKPEVGAGIYSNLAVISHTPSEIYLDFAQMAPGNPEGTAVVNSRIIMSPMHAKRLLAALADNVKKYEEQFGTIKEPGVDNTSVDSRGGTIPFDINPQGNA
ncbi:MAG: DUF3467 domain-containing protein [Bacteroidales bacterium]|nr:DUF3467 domain-containing protein [Bacteroidales bacterium]